MLIKTITVIHQWDAENKVLKVNIPAILISGSQSEEAALKALDSFMQELGTLMERISDAPTT